MISSFRRVRQTAASGQFPKNEREKSQTGPASPSMAQVGSVNQDDPRDDTKKARKARETSSWFDRGREGQSAWLGVAMSDVEALAAACAGGHADKVEALLEKGASRSETRVGRHPPGPARASISPPTSDSPRRPLFLKARSPSPRSPRAPAAAIDPDRASYASLRARSPALTRVSPLSTRPDHAQASTRTRRMRFSARRWWPPREADTRRWSPCCSRKTSIPIGGASGTRP